MTLFALKSPTMYLALHLLLIVGLAGCQSAPSDGQPSVVVEPAGIIGDTTAADGPREEVLGAVRDMTTDTRGHLHVLDRGWEEIRVYGPEGTLERTVALQLGEGPGEVQNPSMLAVGPDGRYYLTGLRSRQVTILDPSGEAAGQFSLNVMPTNIVVADSSVFVTGFWLNTSGGVVRRYSLEGTEKAAFREKPGNWRAIAKTGNFERISRTPRGTLLYSYSWPYRVLELDRSGGILREASGHPTFGGGPETVTERGRGMTVTDQRSSGLAALASGHVLNLVQSREEKTWSMDVFSPDLTFIQRLEQDAFGLPSYRNFAAGGDGEVYFSSPNPQPHIRKYRLAIE